MKLLRIGKKGQEIPAALDKNGKYRNLSPHIKDLNPDTINFENLESLKKINLESLEEIDQNERIGACLAKPGNFFAIGLNYVEHAKETGSVAVNTGAVAIAEAPFGGIKQSGYGREGGSMAIKDYLNVKYTHMGIKG